MEEYKNLPIHFGVDSLYGFYESNSEYDNLYLEVLDQVETIKGDFARKEIRYAPSDINITIKNYSLMYEGFSEGYMYFRDSLDLFRIAFKDTMKNRKLHDIRFELLASGIYTIGIEPIFETISDLLDGFITGHKPITRIDINCFIQYDFGFINKHMFVSKKRNFTEYVTHGSSKRTETLYAGRPPFMLRIYDKTLEMKKSKKKEIMQEFFLNKGFSLKNTISNIEFQLHRAHLKSFEIDTVEDALNNLNNLFKKAMGDIRLIDISKVNESDITNNNKHRVATLPIWEYIKESYDAKEFLQTSFPIQRIKRKSYKYTYDRFKNEFVLLMRKAFIHSLKVDEKIIDDCMELFISSLEVNKQYEYKEDFTDFTVVNKNGTQEKFRLLKDGTIIQPINIISVGTMSDNNLLAYVDELSQQYGMSESDNAKYEIAYKELVKRGLKDYIPF